MYTVAELQILVMAAAYEVYSKPVASDSTYDLLAGVLREDGCSIPGFASHTGSWIHEVLTPDLRKMTEWCIERVGSVPHDDTCHHTYIEEYCKR